MGWLVVLRGRPKYVFVSQMSKMIYIKILEFQKRVVDFVIVFYPVL